MFVRLFYFAWDLGMLSPGLQRLLVRLWYGFVSILDRHAQARFMNYGYAESSSGGPPIKLNDVDERNRYSIQLYHHLASAIDLGGLDVLEVGSGRGGGADYIMRYLHPRSLTGLEISIQAVNFCKRYYSVPGLSFVRGDAERLTFDDHAFDVVVNIESSSHYGRIERFLEGVYRVLSSGGHFLFADIRTPHEISPLCDAFDRAGFEWAEPCRITPNVLQALDLDDERRRRIIQQMPKLLQKTLQEFAGIRGTEKYECFRTGKLQYLSFVLRKKRSPVN